MKKKKHFNLKIKNKVLKGNDIKEKAFNEWNKEKIIDELEQSRLLSKKQINIWKKAPLNLLKSTFLRNTSWRHSINSNTKNLYSVVIDRQGDREIKEISNLISEYEMLVSKIKDENSIKK